MGIKNFVNSEIIAKFPKTHTPHCPSNVQYFYIDANSIVYDVYADLVRHHRDTLPSEKDALEEVIVAQTVDVLVKMITEVVQPQKLCYIALDGTVPKAKTIRSRWRRYKSIVDSEYKNAIRQKYGLPVEVNIWDASANISPGTNFMVQLSKAIYKKIEKYVFQTHQKDCTIVFSDASIPGEGEHKYLPHMKQLRHDTTSNVVVYSPDADMVVLSMLTHKNKIWVMKSTRQLLRDIKLLYEGKEYVYIDVDEVKKSFITSQHLTSFVGTDPLATEQIINDYICLLSLCGDDFVLPIPYLEVKEKTGGVNLLIGIYRSLRSQFREPLLLWNPLAPSQRPQINIPFLMSILVELSKREDSKMRELQEKMKRQMTEQQKEVDQRIPTKDVTKEVEYEEKDLLPYKYFSVTQHPMYAEYGQDWLAVDCNQPKMVWKGQYYAALFGLDVSNLTEYNQERQKISTEYLKSFMFTNIYYFDGLPSWTWYYPYYAPPCVSDLVFALKHFHDINFIPFDQGVPYKPLEQLMFVTAPQNAEMVLPKKVAAGMLKPKSPILSYFPMKYRANVMYVTKWERVEVLFLPFIPDGEILPWLAEVFTKLSKKDSERNIQNTLPLVHRGKEGKGVAFDNKPYVMAMPTAPMHFEKMVTTSIGRGDSNYNRGQNSRGRGRGRGIVHM